MDTNDNNLKILFVDDERKILDGIRRKLHTMRKEWDMAFAIGGYEAKKMMMETKFDVIVTDMRMPGTSGQDLLNIVRDKYPEMIRLVLSGYSDQEVIMQTTKTAHQYLSKPCNVDDIKAAIQRSLSLRKLLREPRLTRLATQLKTIPSLPVIYNEIMTRLQNPDVSLKEIGEIISKDIGMSAKILQIVNSSFFGVAKHIESVERAVALLGLDIIRSLVLSVHLFEKFKESKVSILILNRMWNHSMDVANNAKILGDILGLDSKLLDYTYMAGMMHDIGKLILIAEVPETYQNIMKDSIEEDVPLRVKEREVFHASHAELGAYLLGIWGLQQPVIEAIAYHHVPSASHTDTITPLTAVHLANAFDYELNPSRGDGNESMLDEEYLERLKLDKRKVEKLKKKLLKLIS